LVINDDASSHGCSLCVDFFYEYTHYTWPIAPKIQNIPDAAIDTYDISELGDRFWKQEGTPMMKKAISMRILKTNILRHFKPPQNQYINHHVRKFIVS
jgi:hypothetical protein